MRITRSNKLVEMSSTGLKYLIRLQQYNSVGCPGPTLLVVGKRTTKKEILRLPGKREIRESFYSNLLIPRAPPKK